MLSPPIANVYRSPPVSVRVNVLLTPARTRLLRLLSVQMTFGDAMRNKARLSITGSTGENGRVMTPEFPKAVHAVPYARPDMGLNVSLTDLS